MQNILCIGTEWFSKNGGLSTFNRLLCITLAKTSQIFCYVPYFSSEESEDAKFHNILLIKPKHIPGMETMALLNNKPTLPNNESIDLIIGHDKVTGPSMQAIWDNYYPTAKKILFIHTAPSEIELLKPEHGNINPVGKAEEKETIQKDLAKASHLVVAVGPKLHMEIAASMSGLLAKPPIIRFDPGLFQIFENINYEFDSPVHEVLIMGRVEDFHLKGVDIAFRAMAIVYQNWNVITNNMVIKPRMTVRGAAVGADKELTLKFSTLVPDSNLRPNIRNYSADINVINDDIRKSALVMMPSRAEGFGLVALEAMSLGRPILISENSGLAMLINEIAPHEASNWIIPSDLMNDGIEKWVEKINIILNDRKLAGLQLKKLIEIYNKQTSWDNSVNYLIEQIGILSHTNSEKSIHVNETRIEAITTSLESLEIKQLLQMQPGTKLVNAFLQLPVTRRFKIAEELGLIEPGETLESHNSDKLCSQFISRAYKNKLLANLWDKIFDETKDPNPFKTP